MILRERLNESKDRVLGEFCDEDIELEQSPSLLAAIVQSKEKSVPRDSKGEIGDSGTDGGVRADIVDQVDGVDQAGRGEFQTGICGPEPKTQSNTVGLCSEFLGLINDFKMCNKAKPIANVLASDLEEASVSQFGKTIAKTECIQGARQNASTDIPIEKSNPLGKNISYLRAVTKNDLGVNERQKFSCKSSMKLEYTPYKRGDGVPKIAITPELDAMEKWRKCLVGYFLGAKLPFHIVKREIFKRWSKEGLQRMAYTDNGFYLFEFMDEEVRDKILENGLIHIFGSVMVLKKLHLMMSLSKEACDSVPIWVNFHNLPYEFWSGKSLERIASIIGKPLYVDQATEHLSRITYARVCIEIDAKEEKVEAIRVECDGKSVEVGIKYQWYPLRCDDCKVFGHASKSCPAKPKAVKEEILVSKGNLDVQHISKQQEVWKEVKKGNKSKLKVSLDPSGKDGKEISNNPTLLFSNPFDIMLSCEELEMVDVPGTNTEFRVGSCSSTVAAKNDDNSQMAIYRPKTLPKAAVSDKILKTQVQPAFSSIAAVLSSSGFAGNSKIADPVTEHSNGLLGSDKNFGGKSSPNPWDMEKKEIKKTDKSKLKDRNGNVLCLKEVKKLGGDNEEVEGPTSSVCSDGVIEPVSNPELDDSLLEAFGSKEEGISDMSSPTPTDGLSISDYPSEWSRSRIKKAIRAVKLAGPVKTQEDPP